MNYWNRKIPKIYIYFSQKIQKKKWKQNSNQKNSNSAVEKKGPRDDSSPVRVSSLSGPTRWAATLTADPYLRISIPLGRTFDRTILHWIASFFFFSPSLSLYHSIACFFFFFFLFKERKCYAVWWKQINRAFLIATFFFIFILTGFFFFNRLFNLYFF